MSCCHSFCFVTLRFFCSRPHFIGVAAFASFVPHSAQQPHIFNPKESLSFTHYITFRPFLYVPLSFTTFIRSDKPSSDPAKENYTPRKKLRQHSWGSHRTHFAYATFRALCLPPSLHSQRLRLTLRRQGKHSAIATQLSHRLVAQGCFPLRWGWRCSNPEPK